MPFNVTVEEGQRLQEMNAGAYWLGLRLFSRLLLDIPARLKRQRDNRLTLGPALVARLRCRTRAESSVHWSSTRGRYSAYMPGVAYFWQREAFLTTPRCDSNISRHP
jgi:hypothetical protein